MKIRKKKFVCLLNKTDAELYTIIKKYGTPEGVTLAQFIFHQ